MIETDTFIQQMPTQSHFHRENSLLCILKGGLRLVCQQLVQGQAWVQERQRPKETTHVVHLIGRMLHSSWASIQSIHNLCTGCLDNIVSLLDNKISQTMINWLI